jgi:hypothetical protein
MIYERCNAEGMSSCDLSSNHGIGGGSVRAEGGEARTLALGAGPVAGGETEE